MNTAYMPVPTASLVAKDLLAHAKKAQNWELYYNFATIPVPIGLWVADPFLAALADKRAFHAGILRMEPNSCYNWHVDTDRKVGLNMLLSDDGQSHCLFLNGDPGVVFRTHELEYKADTYYVFNTQVPHTVINTTEPRYMFSLEFLGQDRGLTFDELCKDIKGMDHGY